MQFIIPISPVAKGRPRFRSTGQFVTTYTDKKTKEFEISVKEWFGLVSPLIKYEKESLKLDVIFEVVRGKTVTRKYPTTRPDIDNYIKSLMDAMNGIVFKDDSQVVSIHAMKRYSEDGEGRMRVNIAKID